MILETDASDFAIGGILSQMHDDGQHPVGFYSRKLRHEEINYDTHDKELLSIIECFKAWRHFTMETPTPVTVYSDHNNLKYFMTTKELNRRQVRYAQFLSDFYFRIIHRPGKLNVCADALSRRPQDSLDMGDRDVQKQCLLTPEVFHPITSNKFLAVVEANKDTVHVKLLDRIRELIQSDMYYHNVGVWLEDNNPNDKFPPDSGKLTDCSEEEYLTYGRQGFSIDESDELLYYKGMIYVPPELRLTILMASHDSQMAGHWGTTKTLEQIQRTYWWPKMRSMVQEYVSSCTTCQRTKPDRQKPAGLLHPLPVASERWSSLTIDFMTDLPPCQGYDSIMVVVDRFTKMAHFMPCTKDITAEQTSTLFTDRVFRLHGLPQNIISDRGPQFNSALWKEFWKSLGVEVILSTSFHPETDGQTERVNGVINQYMRVYSSYMQDNWVELLPTAEFAYNNAIHSATGVTPFYADTGRHPRTAASHSTSGTDDPELLAAHLSELADFLRINLEQARVDMKKYADIHRRKIPAYKPGDKVMLSTLHITSKRPKAKWSDRRMGPFKIIKESHEGNDAYVLDIPTDYGIHPVFHSSLLLPYKDNIIKGREQEVPLPIMLDDHEEFVVEKILAWRPYYGSRQFLVKFMGYENPTDNRWIHKGHLDHCREIIQEYLATNPATTSGTRSRRKK
ncbi:MAG: hypothetical protein EOO61_07030 [Hymenobacter sp.]|nr:MAG: hypothetical protein EOO61_07030 [Hymenobacter sp.]